ncbi:thioester reductase domain-containing protein, partial [Pseudonocardia alaniniphila]|uniref:thioester reductase domain-containing protein n=1 Tax=Pseudonocardia alaniniphila TaxID=75291 RepID=UPI0031D9F9DD
AAPARLVAAECAGQHPSGLLATTTLAAAQAELVTDAPADVLRLGPASAEYWSARASRPRPAAEVEATPEGRPHTLVAGPSAAQVGGPAGLETAVARLWVAGGQLDWTRVNGPRPAALPRLPGYAFQRRTHWTDAATAAITGEGRRRSRPPGWLPPTLLRTATGPAVAQTAVSLATVPFLDEHRVHGRIVVPGVVFLELVLRTAAEVLGGEAALGDLELQRPLVLADDETATLQVVLDPPADGRAAVQVFSAAPDGGWNRHLRCSVAAGGPEGGAAPAVSAGPWPELTGDGQEFYRDAWHPDFRLGESFRVVTRYGRRDGVAVGDIGEPPAHAAGLAAGIRPELLRLDAAVQLVGAARPGAGGSGPVHLGTGFERLVVHGSLDHPTLRGTATLRDTAPAAGGAVGDLVLCAPDGTVAAELLGVAFRPVTPDALDRVSTTGTMTTTDVAELDRAAFDAADAAGREALLAAHLAALLAAVRHSAVDDVARDVPLVDLADSLMLAELESAAHRSTGVRITLETLFRSTGVDDLARTLAPQITGPGTTPDEATTAPRRPPSRTRRMTVDEMLALAELDPAITARGAPSAPAPAATLLTGATGYVGAFLLDELLRRDGADVLCHVRAADEQEATARITSNLQRYGIDVGDAAGRIRPVLGDLAEPRLGLTEDAFTALHEQVGSVLHCGGMVKWTYPYRGLAPANVDGTREVLRLATLGDPRPVHFISTVGVFSSTEYEPGSVGEDEPLENSGPLVVGYAQSKWVAERMVRTAAERGLPVTIHRINTGWHSTTGAFNRMDHLMMILKGCMEAGLAPDTMAMPVQPAPIDVVARGVVALSAQAHAPEARTFHLVHDRPISWTALFDLVEQHGYPMRRLPFDEWRTTITNRSSGTLALLGLAPFLEDTADDVRLPVSTSEETRRALGEAVICPPIDADLVGTVLRSFVTAGFVDPPAQL